MLSDRWLKDHVRTAENYQMLYAKFHVLFKNNQQSIAPKLLSAVVLALALENFICTKPIQRFLNKLQTYSIGCSLVLCSIDFSLRLTATSALSDY